MGLLSRIYFNAVFGALGGLIGWMLFGIFGQKELTSDNEIRAQLLLGGLLIGGSIGYFVVSVEAIRDRAWLRIVRLASYGLLLGGVGGAIGMYVGDLVNTMLVGELGADRQNALVFVGTMFARGLGWMFLGLAIGVSEGIAARSLGKLSYGTLGGAIGGFVGGALFGLAYQVTLTNNPNAALWSALGLIILGACIGSLSALVQGIFQPASVRVLQGWQEGREYGLIKEESLLGREEHADIPLFRDMKVEKRHAIIRREGGRYLLVNNQSPPEYTLVNDRPVPGVVELHDGDRIRLGNVLLRFQMREARATKGPPSRPPVIAPVARR
jgi:hypothetical protein